MIRYLVLGHAGALVIAFTAIAGHATGFGDSARSACAREYKPCLPVRADLDCTQIDDSMKPVRVTGADPYGLDRDRNGLGCELDQQPPYTLSPWGVILRKPPRKEATSARVGDVLTVVGWSPFNYKGANYNLCIQQRRGFRYVLGRGLLTGAIQTFGTVNVASKDGRGGRFTLWLDAKSKARAHPTPCRCADRLNEIVRRVRAARLDARARRTDRRGVSSGESLPARPLGDARRVRVVQGVGLFRPAGLDTRTLARFPLAGVHRPRRRSPCPRRARPAQDAPGLARLVHREM